MRERRRRRRRLLIFPFVFFANVRETFERMKEAMIELKEEKETMKRLGAKNKRRGREKQPQLG